jgi:general stress protein YciG
MTRQEAGRLGGRATFARHGPDHMARIGARGFAALCRRFPSNSRRFALFHLHGKGLLEARYVPRRSDAGDDAIAAEMYRELGLEADGPQATT